VTTSGAAMGQQASSFLTPCVARGKHDLDGDTLRCLKRAEALLAEPEKLERECDFHFRRTGLDAHGDLRRVELRRLLWTIAHSLGSTELTWEAIEAAAVVGTLEPHVPVVTRAEFFRCVLKTVHLVAAELRRKAELQQSGGQPAVPAVPAKAAPSVPRSANPWAALAERHGGAAAAAMSSSSRSTSPTCSSGISEVPSSGKGKDKGKGKGKGKGAGKSKREEPSAGGLAEEPFTLPLFLPAPGGSPDEAATINGMTAKILSNEGTLDPQRLFVGRGMLELSDLEAKACMTQRLLCADGRTAFDLTLLEAALSGKDILRSPVAQLLPSAALEGEALNCVLVLSFSGDEVLCLWFATTEDCELCHNAVMAEAAAYKG